MYGIQFVCSLGPLLTHHNRVHNEVTWITAKDDTFITEKFWNWNLIESEKSDRKRKERMMCGIDNIKKPESPDCSQLGI